MASLIDIFEREVARSSSSPCVFLEDQRIYSYRNVDDVATCIAKELACAVESASAVEIDSETPLVAVMMTRGVGLVSAILGILKAGTAYVPVDPSFPPDRQMHIFSHSNCKMLITDEESLQLAQSLGVEVPPTLVINSSILLVNGEVQVNTIITGRLHLPFFDNLNKVAILSIAREKVSDRKDGGLAYVLYTSGSTGKPKGVMLNQTGVVNIVNWFADELGVTSASRVLGLTTFCFDISVLEMFLPLFRGGGLVMVNQSSQKDPFQLLDIVRDCKVSVLQATPTTFEMLFATGWTGDTSIDFLVGGEAFRPSILPLAHKCRSLRNVYGPTETTIWSSSFTLPSDNSLLTFNNGVPVIPIGRPISQTVFYIVTEDETTSKREVAVGSEGELWIGGIGVARGYLNAPDLTKEKFFPNPFGEGHVYRTGDIVTRLQGGKGDYVFLRRMDDQVKIDGFRIELAEIETVFATHKLVDKAVAVVKDSKLVLYIKAAGSTALSTVQLDAILTHAARSLTHYMMPRSMVQVLSFPETANGKLDRKALPDPTQKDLCNYSHAEVEGGSGSGDSCGRSSGHVLSSDPSVGSEEFLGNLGLILPELDDRDMERQSRQHQRDGQHHSQRAVTAMARHICDTIEKLRGRRPAFSSSFASIGVDSLGAVMFIKYLSDSLGGIRIEPSKIYAAGITIKSFAEALLIRLEREKPEALLFLDIHVGNSDDLELGEPRSLDCLKGDLDPSLSDPYMGDEDPDELFVGAGELQKLENSFEDIMSTNRAAIEGIRGVFTFLVLYDHFHNPHNAISASFAIDTYLFIMISGFTTALQLRESPQFLKVDALSGAEELPLNPIVEHLDSSNPMIDSTKKGLRRQLSSVEEDTRSLFLPASTDTSTWCSIAVKGEERVEGLKLKSRTSFQIGPFILSRCVGLFPILWVALLLNIPPWMNEIHVSTAVVRGTCSVLYVIGMQSWWRPTCRFYGPNNLLYASILLNCFILYSLGRLLVGALQERCMSWSSKELSPVTLKPPRRMMRTRTWKQWMGDKAVMLTYNRTDMPTMLVMLVVWSGVAVGLFAFMRYNTYAKNALSFIAYFVVGVIAASVLENVHYAFWDWGRKHAKDTDRSNANGFVSFAYRVYNYTDPEPSWPWVHNSWWLSYFYTSATVSESSSFSHGSPIKAAYSPLSASARMIPESLDTSRSPSQIDEDVNIPTPPESSTIFITCCYLWRFFPDLSAIGIGFLMSTLGDLDKESIKLIIAFVIVPYAYLVLLLVSMLQKGSARYNFARFFLECAPLTTLGYTSYAMYLFQRVSFTCYLPFLYFGIKTGHFDISRGNPDDWFEHLPNFDKFIAVVSLTLICLVVHKYYQDKFVPYCYAHIVSKMSHFNGSGNTREETSR